MKEKAESLATNFRLNHLFQLLEEFDNQTKPLDVVMANYFRSHKAIGSKDRAFIAESAYAMVRWKGLIDYLVQKGSLRARVCWKSRWYLFSKVRSFFDLKDPSIPLHHRLSVSEFLLEEVVKSHGLEKAAEICLAWNTPAPTTVRVNPLKIQRDELFKRFVEQGYKVALCHESKLGIRFLQKVHFFSMLEFKEGLFEVQDEASQLVADMIRPEPQQHVLDYCSGSGGKTLAFAHYLEGTGQLYLHDIRDHALEEARKRLRRAGITNVQIIAHSEIKRLKNLKGKMDWVLVDAPCSGTGTFRRNPDMKWKFTLESLYRLTVEQRKIFEEALTYVKKGGHIVYATCSILKSENQDQVDYFLNNHPLSLQGSLFESVPIIDQKDGFFAAHFQKLL